MRCEYTETINLGISYLCKLDNDRCHLQGGFYKGDFKCYKKEDTNYYNLNEEQDDQE